jgi:hypothetical protein
LMADITIYIETTVDVEEIIFLAYGIDIEI